MMRPSTPPDADPALRRAFVLHLLSEGFRSPDPLWKERFAALRPAASGQGISLPVFPAEVLAEEHFRLFGPAPACPLELAFHLAENPFEQARIMAHIAGFYRAFGLDPEAGERPDNLSVVLSFLSFLTLKERNAAEKGLEEAGRVTAQAVADLVREFVSPGVAAFSGKLAALTSNAFYSALAERLRREIFNIHAPPAQAVSRWEPRPEEAEEGEMTCGALKRFSR